MRSIQSLMLTAHDQNKIQILLAFDQDDDLGQGYWDSDVRPWLDQNHCHYMALRFEPMGYQRLNEYYNALARYTNPDWFFVFNDDAIMKTQNWDQVITSYAGQFRILKVHTHREHPYSIFPIIPKKWFEILGHLSRHQMIDAEVSQMAYLMDIMQIIAVDVEHDCFSITGNNQDQTHKAKVHFEGNPQHPRDFHNKHVTLQRFKDCEKIISWMESQNLDTTRWNQVRLNAVDPWEKLKQNDPNGQMKSFSIEY